MKLFSTRQPRHYRRSSIYTDESRDRLQQLVNDVKREQGEPVSDQRYNPDKFRGTFGEFTPRVQRNKDGLGKKLGWPVAIVVIFALIIIWRLLLSGRI